MNRIGSIKFPQSSEIFDLYLRHSEATLTNDQVILSRGEVVSSNSYFNSFYENYYTKYTTIRSFYYLLNLEGDFKISVYREVAGSQERETIAEATFEHCQLSNSVQLPPIQLREENAGRIYFELTCLSDRGIFAAGTIATDESKSREVSLGIVICTFKKENYVRNTLAAILQDEQLQDKDFKVYVIDNGQTLDKSDFRDSRVKLVPNRNAGGSGGFTRGLIEGLEENVCSHFLLMDDDIELESESICRLFAAHEYAKSDFIVAGGLLNLNKKYELYEAGATFNGSSKARGTYGSLIPLNHRMDLRTTDVLNRLLIEDDPDYGGFWFCSFSRAIVEQINLPLPLFIKLDDVEFCMRAKQQLNLPIVTFPAMAVWHIPASDKNLNWEFYYYFRNDLITFAIHFSPSFSFTVGNLTREIISSLLRAKYDRAHMLIKAFEDYLKGPDFIKNSVPEVMHPSILKLSRTYESQDQISKLAAAELLSKWFKVVANGRSEWSSVTRAWKNDFQEVTSIPFWQQYLELKKPEYTSVTIDRQ